MTNIRYVNDACIFANLRLGWLSLAFRSDLNNNVGKWKSLVVSDSALLRRGFNNNLKQKQIFRIRIESSLIITPIQPILMFMWRRDIIEKFQQSRWIKVRQIVTTCTLDRFTKTFFWNFQSIPADLCYILIWLILRCWGNSSILCQQNSDAL